ncbi:MAG TPA: cytochrome b/b6 domain-containing protein [Burkholderiaceae bacterium]|nr:cytochrome b/b6 domain-containing protein [Burkholderiaceae bacterium]
MTSSSHRFTPAQRALHWIMSTCIFAMLFIGIGMVSTIRPLHLELVAIHEPLGIAILLLAALRLVLRLRRGAPALPPDLPPVMKQLALLSHVALYALMFAMPLIGWAMLSAADYPAVVFGQTLPPIAPVNPSLHATLWTAHQVLALCFFALILLHLAAGLFHALVRKDGVFEAMAPTAGADRIGER